jgi:23S rRNA maturation mini-RNase III
MRILFVLCMVLIIVGCATKKELALDQELKNIEICAVYSIENEEITNILKNEINSTIEEESDIHKCGANNTNAKLNMEFNEYWLSNTLKSVIGVLTLSLARPVTHIEADIELYYKDTGVTQKIKDNMHKTAWFVSKEEQLKVIPELVNHEILRIVRASQNITTP